MTELEHYKRRVAELEADKRRLEEVIRNLSARPLEPAKGVPYEPDYNAPTPIWYKVWC